ncbi:MAG: hypothetical protein MRZ79_09490 [Bacteroidia bacterium]|nr:hypothetical protein [Bacteroidia bacterium]
MRIKFGLFMLLVLGMWSCNPFAPAYDPDGLAQADLLGDPSNIDGFFQRFKNAYELRDTALYGELFSKDFIFEYYDQELGQTISWDRATELLTSFNLFQSSLQINLDWNFYVELDSTTNDALVLRNFNLTIETEEQGTFSGSGRARFRLQKGNSAATWKAVYWFDDSDF